MKKVGNIFLVVPMTTGGKDNKFYYTLPDHYFAKTSRIILSQARMIDKNRMTDKVLAIGKEDFADIKEKLRTLLF